MADDDGGQEPRSRPYHEMAEKAASKEKRKLRSRLTTEPDIWFWLGMFGLVGWSVAVPALIGVALGLWLDETWPMRFSWALTLLAVGVAIGCWNAWRWVRQESSNDRRQS